MDQKRFRGTLRRTFWIPFGVGVILAVVLILELQLLVRSAARVEHTDEVISVFLRTYQGRGDQIPTYVLTKDRRFLDAFYEGRKQFLVMEPRLRQLISGSADQTARDEKVLRAFRAWLAWADQAIAMTESGTDASDVKFQLRGKELLDQYRQSRRDFLQREQELRGGYIVRSHRSLRFVTASVVALCSLFGLGFASLGRKQLTSLSKYFTEALGMAEVNAARAQAQGERLQATLTSIGDGVIVTDADGLITLMNPVAERLTGWKLDEASGKPLADVFRFLNQEAPETAENPGGKVRRVNQVVAPPNHRTLISRGGQEIAIDDSRAPIFNADGALVGVVFVFRDVTRQRALEAALQSNERLALAGRLSASIAHEIHNPLDTVGNVLFLVSQRIDKQPQIQQLITIAQSEVQRVTEISRNMLSLHRESRAASRVKLSDLLEGVVALIEETIAKDTRKIHLVPGFQGEVEAFPSELRQVFTNVIKNAVEATAVGGEIKIFCEVTQQSGRSGVLVRVVDNGVGVSDEMKSKLFSPFVSSKEEGGTGLGLWVSRSIIEKHGGTIRLSSSFEPNHCGTTVSIFLPLEALPSRKVADTTLASPVRDHGPGRIPRCQSSDPCEST